MSCRFARSFLALALGSCVLAVAWAAEPPPADSKQELLVLRNGEVLAGHVTREDAYYRVVLNNGELRVKMSETELVCANLDEAYAYKRNRLALGRADDHLDLAEWCLRQGLPGYAAKEISAALAIDPQNRRSEFLDRRLRQMLEAPPQASAEKPVEAHPVTNEDLDRLVRGMPPGTVDAFTSTIQPLLMNSCATSGCHGPGSKSNYVILRIPSDRSGARRLTQRNLQSSVQMLDYQNPLQSKLLTSASRPHGSAASAIFDQQTVKYRQLYNWIALVTQRMPGGPDASEQPATVGFGGQAAKNQNQMNDAAAIAEVTPRPAKVPYRVRTAKSAASHTSGADSSSKDPFGAASQAGTENPAAPGNLPAESADPFSPEAFNRQFADPPPSEPKAK
jgi:hypothetical protein